MADTRAHTLVITATGEDDDYDWTITCPWNGERNAPGRPCTTWWECDCKLTDEQKTALSDDGEGPCSTSPTGWHRPMSFGSSYPGLECWATECSSTTDEVGDIFRERGAGTYLVSVEDADEDSITLAPAVPASPAGGTGRRYTTRQRVDVYDPHRDAWERIRITDTDHAGRPTWGRSTGNDIPVDLRDVAPAYIRPHAEKNQTEENADA